MFGKPIDDGIAARKRAVQNPFGHRYIREPEAIMQTPVSLLIVQPK